MKRIALALGLLLVLGAPLAASAEDFFFKPHDRVMFLGDSITEQYQYSTDIELYLTTRFPKGDMLFLNAGISGDVAHGGSGRFAQHVLAEKPTAVTINFGMNDAGYGAFNADTNKRYVEHTEKMLQAAKDVGVRVALLSPNAVDRRVQEKFKLYLETQKQFYAPLRELAEKYQDTFVDQYAVTRTALEKMEADGAKNVIPFGDGFHTAPSGGLFMAHAILVGMHAPALVSDVSIDASKNTAEGKACKVEQLAASPKSVTFTRTDEALPLPVQKDWESLLPYVNDLKDLNWYGLKVAGLSGKYSLTIDDQPVGDYTAEQLAAGVNLGNVTTGPIHAQGQKVFDAINQKNGMVHQRFRGVVMFNAPDWLADVANERKPAELQKRMNQIQERQKQVYELAQPVPHKFELTQVQ